MEDRRHEPRVKALNLVHVEEYKYPSLTEYKTDDTIGRTMDLSHDGMNLELDHCLPLKTLVKLDLALGNLVLQLQGKVRSIREVDEHTYDHGIEFKDLSPEDYEALEEHLELRADD
jgi:PilZ domain-containing protein